MGTASTATLNRNNILANGRKARALYNKTWNLAARAPIFCKITKHTGPDGKTPIKKYRTARLINSHAYNIAASGAGLYASRVLANDCEAVRVGAIKENARAPWAPTVSKGARMVIEQFLCALAQEAAMKGDYVKAGAGSVARLNKSHMLIGWEATAESVFSADRLIAKECITTPMPTADEIRAAKKAKKAKQERMRGTQKKGEKEPVDDDDDYSPPADE